MTSDRPYHHGDLACALRQAAIAVITEKGPAGFSLREVARRAGVSHAAPAHHYGDTRGLLTAIAVEAFQHLHASMEAAVAGVDDPREQFVRIGVAYVRAGLEHPAHCAVVFRKDLVDHDDPQYHEWGLKAYLGLHDTVARVRDRYRPDLDVDTASGLAWSAMQGLLTLLPSMEGLAGRHGLPLDDALTTAERFCRLLLEGLAPLDGRRPRARQSRGRVGSQLGS